MSDFTPGELGFLRAWLVGGPLDGTTYSDMPVFPDGKPSSEVTMPLDDALFARYARRDSAWLDGRWYYDFVEVTADPILIAPHSFPARTIVGAATLNSTGAEDEASQYSQQQQLAPSPRFVLAQAWWLASELCRRNSRLRIVDAWPLDGFYHGLEVGERQDHDHVFMNFLGAIHQIPNSFSANYVPIDWARVIGAESPHEIVKEIEHRMRWGTAGADPTTARSLVYRCIASILAAKINDRERWNVADAYSHGVFVEWPDFLDEFEGCRLALQKDTDPSGPASTRIWVLTRGRTIVALLSETGTLFRRDARPRNLLAIYKERRRLEDVTTLILGASEPAPRASD